MENEFDIERKKANVQKTNLENVCFQPLTQCQILILNENIVKK